ncbi:unnamed protein product [Schistosoma margrebowiei]|uniref:Uncharacterized protein n=1 Tax=Schistosoma margrebowiei TaxID=48269 RepID=A0AA84ZDX3_9TREM|nr:unnamed protein product [Schistosoma margrebowiei]
MYVCSRIDPLFFFISFCRKNDKFISWDAILSEIGGCFDVFSNIPNMESRLEEICDKRCSKEAEILSTNQLSHQTCLRLAYQLVADYLSPDLFIKLQEKIGLKTTEFNSPDMNSSENINPIDDKSIQKSFDSKNYQPKEDYSSALKLNESKINEPIIKKAKIPKGVQSITNFFNKK